MSRGPFDAVSGDSADTSVYISQEGAYVHLSLQWGLNDGPEERHDVLLTPDMAESMSFALSEDGKSARGFSQ